MCSFLFLLPRPLSLSLSLSLSTVLCSLCAQDGPEFNEGLAKASVSTPLSVVVIGVGDGPFGTLAKFDDDVKGKK